MRHKLGQITYEDDELLSVVSRILEVEACNLDSTKSLKDQGMDSLKLLYLIDALEKNFGIAVLGENLLQENFRSVSAIRQFLKDNYDLG